jgi:hypothetical protein
MVQRGFSKVTIGIEQNRFDVGATAKVAAHDRVFHAKKEKKKD